MLLTRGVVEVCESEVWGTICEDQWDDSDASVVCTQLQFSRHGTHVYLYKKPALCLFA